MIENHVSMEFINHINVKSKKSYYLRCIGQNIKLQQSWRMFLYFQTKLGLFFILLLSLLKNLLVSRSSKENVREEKRTTSDTHMGHNRNCHSLEALRITQKTSTREEKFLAGKKLASTSCVEADRLNRVLFFSVADSRSAPYGCSELPRCVLHDTAFWNHFKFWQTRLFLVQLSRS